MFAGFNRYFHNFPQYPEPKFPSSTSNSTAIAKSSEINTKFDDGVTHSRVIFQDNDKGGYKVREGDENEKQKLEYALLQKAIKLQVIIGQHLNLCN